MACGAFIVGSILPPYVPTTALSSEDEIFVPPQQFLFVEEGFLMKSTSLTKQGARLAYSESIIYTVQEGDNLEHLARRHGISVQTIQWVNHLEPGAPIQPGQELVILPVDGVLHEVKRGQTLSRIAQLYDVAAEEIARQNKIVGGFIVAGQQLIVPGGKPIVARSQLTFARKLPAKDLRLPVPAGQEAVERRVERGVAASPTLGVLQMPCNTCFYTQYFRAGHYGVDMQTKGSGPVFAAEAGVVIRADSGWNGGYGNVVEIDHGNGLITLYAHNKELYVQVGEQVQRGQAVSWMGNSGRVYGQTGIHLHFEVHLNGVKKNPLLYLQ